MARSPRRQTAFFLSLIALSASSLAAQPIRVSGQIFAWEGKRPLAGARVELYSAYESTAAILHRMQEKAEPEPLVSVRTRENGSFEISAPESGCYEVIIRAEGLMTERYPLIPLIEEEDLPPTYLRKALPLEVRAVGPDGRPLSGIEIRTVSLDVPEFLGPSDPRTWLLASRRGVTGKDGMLVLTRARSEGLKLVATSPLFLGQESLEIGPGEERPVTLTLSPRKHLIEVRGGDGNPGAGALVRWRSWPVGVTGPDGRLQIALPAGSPPLIVESREGWRAVVEPGEKLLPVRLVPPRRAAGRVIGATSRTPIPGALVWSGSPLFAPPVRVGAHGEFHLEVPGTDGSWLEAAAADHHLMAERRFIPKQGAGSLTLALDPAATLSGVVVDAAGRPVQGVAVSPSPPPKRAWRGWGNMPSWSRSDGRFRLTGLLPLGTYELTAVRKGFGRTRVTARTASPGKPSQEVRIVLDPGRTVFGRVMDEAGRPVAGADLLMLAGLRTGSIAERHDASSDETGRFELRGVSPGTYDLWIERKGFSKLSLSDVRVPAETEATDLGALTLPAGAAIEGRVTDLRGLPLAGAEVGVFPGDREEQTVPWFLLDEEDGDGPVRAKTDADGNFRIEDLKRGKRFDLKVTHTGHVEESLPGIEAPTAESLRIEMRTARSLVGRVVGSEGEPVADASLSQIWEVRTGSSGGGGMVGSWNPLGSTDVEGRFRLTGLSPGPVDIEVIAKGYQSKRLEGLRIPEDKDVEGVEIVLDRSAIVRVKVVTVEGEPVARAWVSAHPEAPADSENRRLRSPWRPRDDRTDEQGLCLVEVPKPGRYRVSASGQGPSASEVVEVGPAGASIELRLDPGLEVAGRVVDEEGFGIAGAAVSLKNAEASGNEASYEVSSDADGSFLHRGIRDGAIRLKASRKGYAEAVHPEAVIVAGRSVHGIEIRLTQDETYGNAVITGRLLGLSPEDMARVRVSARTEPFFQGTPGKVTDGVYRIEGLKPGEWKVTASTPSGHKAGTSTRIDPGVAEVAADLEFSGFTLSGRILVDGAPLTRAKLMARGKNPKVFGQTSTDHAGNFVLRNLPRGTYHLILGPEEGIGDVRSLDLTEDQTVALQISTGKIRGRLVSKATGEPVPDTAVLLDGWSQALDYFFSVPSTRSNEDGDFESVRLAPGTYKLKVQKEGFAPAETTVTVRSGETREVTIPLTPVN